MRKLFAAAALAAVVSCVPSTSHAADYKKTYHVDTNVTPLGMATLQYAAAIWEQFSQGRVKITLVQDLNVAKDEPSKWDKSNLILGIEEEILDTPLSPAILAICLRLSPKTGEKGVGMSFAQPCSSLPTSAPTRIAFLPAHISSPQEMAWVMVHEFGHALGFPHVDAPTAVMAPYYNPDVSWFSPEDKAMCVAHGFCSK